VLDFWWKVSSEQGYDWLEFYVNGVLQNRISGQSDWAHVAIDIPPGFRTLRWRYVKDDAWSDGLDAAWLDQVTFKSAAVVALTNLDQVYDRRGKTVSALTDPPGLAVSLSYDGSDAAPTNAGSYRVIATVIDPIHTGSASNTLIVAKAVLTATADNKVRTYSVANPPFTISYAGLASGHDTESLDSPPTANAAATIVSPPGAYAITLTGGVDNNYAFSLVNGTLTITPPPLLIKSVTVTNGVAVITWSAIVGQRYRVQYKNELTQTDWFDLSPDVLANEPIAVVTDLGYLLRRFYRVWVAP
jgi:hypothetical protein